MAKKGGFFKFIFTVIIIAAVAFAVIYFFFPETSEKYFSMSWDSRGGDSSEALEDVVSGLSEALEEAGASEEQINEILSRADVDDIREALEQAVVDGKAEIDILVESISDKIDLGDLDLDAVKKNLAAALKDVDFSAALDQIKGNLEEGLSSLRDALKNAID